MQAVRDCPGLVRISAGNYGGRLGKTKIYLRELAQAAEGGQG
jgi:formylmethanofuran:tetrahydromethanopterin formyltransferase